MSSLLAGILVLHKLHIGPTRLEFLPLLISVIMLHNCMLCSIPLSSSPVANIHHIGIYLTDNDPPTTLSPVLSYKFPHSSIPAFSLLRPHTSPTLSVSSSDSILCLRFETLPSTPLTSDDKFVLPSLWFNPSRAAIKPFAFAKHKCLSINISIQWERMPYFRFPLITMKNSMEQLSLSSSSEDSFHKTDNGEGKSDSEWY